MSNPIFRPLNTGDPNDDDGQVIDNLLTDTSEPPTPISQPIDIITEAQRPVPTRLFTGEQLIDITWSQPTLLMPADTNREHLTIRAFSTNPGGIGTPADAYTDFVYIMDETGKPGARLHHGQSLTLDKHTGAVWVTCQGLASPATSAYNMYVSYWATTK